MLARSPLERTAQPERHREPVPTQLPLLHGFWEGSLALLHHRGLLCPPSFIARGEIGLSQDHRRPYARKASQPSFCDGALRPFENDQRFASLPLAQIAGS